MSNPESEKHNSPEKPRVYNITCTEDQAIAIVAGLELYWRLRIGQVHVLREALPRPQAQDVSHDAFEAIKTQYFPGLAAGASNAINEADSVTVRCHDVWCVLRHAVSWARCPTGGITCNFDPPITYGTDQKPAVTVSLPLTPVEPWPMARNTSSGELLQLYAESEKQ